MSQKISVTEFMVRLENFLKENVPVSFWGEIIIKYERSRPYLITAAKKYLVNQNLKGVEE